MAKVNCKEPSQIQSIAVIGTGSVGASWASLFLAKGIKVQAYDRHPEAKEKAEAFVKAAWPALRELGVTNLAMPDFKLLSFFSTIKEAISAKGLNPKIAALIPADVEPTDEAVTKWLSEYGDVFSPPSTDQAAEPVEGTPNVDPVELAAQQAIIGVEGTVTAPSGLQDFQARLQGAESTEELLKLIAQSG